MCVREELPTMPTIRLTSTETPAGTIPAAQRPDVRPVSGRRAATGFFDPGSFPGFRADAAAPASPVFSPRWRCCSQRSACSPPPLRRLGPYAVANLAPAALTLVRLGIAARAPASRTRGFSLLQPIRTLHSRGAEWPARARELGGVWPRHSSTQENES